MSRIPHGNSPTEIRQGFQRMEASVSILQEGTTGQYLAGQGIGSYPAWIDPVVLTAGSGLSGGGDISADRTFDLDINGLSAASIAAGDFVPFWDITATATNKKITFANFEGTLNHDSLTGFISDEHIAHSGVTITAGSGLAGGGDITVTRTIDLDINSLSVATIAAGDFVPFWDLTSTATNKKITFANFESTLNHDNLSGFVMNEHIDHSGVTITAGSGLTGTSDITASFTLAMDINGLAVATIVAGDFVPFWDITATAANKKTTFANFEAALTHDNLLSGTIVSHDTTATGANLTSMTDDSMVDSLHRHSELSASDGTPNAAFAIDADGLFTFSGGGAIEVGDTTTSTAGVILKGGDVWLHNFHHPTGGGAIPIGQNVFLGKLCGNLTIGSTATFTYYSSNNVAIGYNSLTAITTGYNNVAIGLEALKSFQAGQANVGIGRETLRNATSGNNNIAISTQALRSSTAGSSNIAIGVQALYGITTSGNNLGFGAAAGRYLANGSSANQTPTYGLYLGSNCKASTAGRTNETVIGKDAIGSGSNTITLGGSAVTDTIIPYGDVGIGTGSPDAKLQVVGVSRFGEDTTNYSEFESDGTLEFNGTATVFKDTNIGAATLSGPPGKQPGIVNFVDEAGADTGIATYGLAVGEGFSGSFEIQHDYKEGSDLLFHLHWQGIAAPTGTDKVQFQLTYTVSKFGETLDPVTVITTESDYDTQYEQLVSAFAVIDGTNFNKGNQFIFTLERIAASADEYGGESLIMTVGIHYEINVVGSRTSIPQ